MSTRTEERLSAALAARAEQVRPDDLRPAHVPSVHRRRWAPALVAAALVALVASPFVVDGLEGEPAPAPATPGPPTASSSPTPTKSPEGRVVTRHGTADVDGDGQADQVELRFRTGRALRIFSARVTVTLATGRTVSDASGASEPPVLDAPRDINGDGRQVVVTRTESGDADTPQLFAFRQGRLQHLAYAYGVPPLVNAVDADGHVLRFWFDGQDRLFSVRGLTATRDNHATVAVYRWTVRSAPGGGPQLGATRLDADRCFDLERSAFGSGCR